MNVAVITLTLSYTLMKLSFTVSEPEAVAFSENFRLESPTHRKARRSSRLFLPIILCPILLMFVYRFGFSPVPIGILLLLMVSWYVFYPMRYDSLCRRRAALQMQEPAFQGMFGSYDLDINEDCLLAVGAAGESKYNWDAVRRTELTDEYLFIYLSGPMGYPISIRQVGAEVATQANEEINRLRKIA